MSTKEKRREVRDFFNNEYLDYAKYVVESRAIPSVIDGFKPTQRKIAHAANKIWRTGNEKPMKVFQLAGVVASTTFYHHGNGSLENSIIGMAQEFKNSMALFQGIGQFGSLRSPEAGAPRYVGVKLNSNFKLLYKDFELLDPQHEEGEEIEPKFFLPIIPTVLLNGSSGIAVGFATNVLNRNPLDLINACLDVINEKKRLKELKPWLKDFHGTYEKAEEGERSWVYKGLYEVKNTTTVEITEIPPGFTYEKYETHLNSLIERGLLVSYDDNSSGRVNYTLKFTRQVLSDLINREKLEDTLKMQERETENLTVLDEFGKLKIFNSAEEVVRYFVDFRLGYYQKRKEYMVDQLNSELKVLSNRAKFIKGIIEDKIKVNKVAKEKIVENLAKMKFDEIDGSYNYLLNMSIYSLTLERYNELLRQVEVKKAELEEIKKADIKDLYRKDLNELKAKL